MKSFKTSNASILGELILFLIPNIDAGDCNSHKKMNANIECSTDNKKCIDPTEKELLYKVEA